MIVVTSVVNLNDVNSVCFDADNLGGVSKQLQQSQLPNYQLSWTFR